MEHGNHFWKNTPRTHRRKTFQTPCDPFVECSPEAKATSPCRKQCGNQTTSGILREFLPKGKDFRSVSREELDQYVSLFNNRPRKYLEWHTPTEPHRELTPPPLRLH